MDTKTKMYEYLDEQIIEDLELVEECIIDNIESEVELLDEISRYLIDAGGKRVRPAFVLVAFRAVGGKDIEKVIPIAAATEIIHTATLIHDDINDSSRTRRGIPTVNERYGLSRALVTGDFLFVKAFRIGGAYDWKIVKITADACAHLAEGELLQSMNRYNVSLSLDEYKDTISKKTASLISACGAVGAAVAGASDDVVEAMGSYGQNIGMTFQIIDDILDIEGDESTTGKPLGSDIKEGQLSAPLIRALSVLSEEKRNELAQIIQKREKSQDEIDRAIDLVKETDALTFSNELAKEYGEKAREALGVLQESEYKDNLELLIDALLERKY